MDSLIVGTGMVNAWKQENFTMVAVLAILGTKMAEKFAKERLKMVFPEMNKKIISP